MTRVHDLQAKRRPSGGKDGNARRSAYAPTAYEIRGSAVEALAQIGLEPREARLVVIPSSARAEQKLKQSAFGRPLSAGRLSTGVPGLPDLSGRPKAPVIDKAAFAPDARSRAVLEGIRIAQQDLHDAGGAYDLDQVRTLMHGVSRQRVDRRVKERTLLAVPGPSNRRVYPTVQFTRDGNVVEGLKPVLDALPTRNPWATLNFLVRPDSRLRGRRPIDLLKAGEIERVVDAARRVGQQGA